MEKFLALALSTNDGNFELLTKNPIFEKQLVPMIFSYITTCEINSKRKKNNPKCSCRQLLEIMTDKSQNSRLRSGICTLKLDFRKPSHMFITRDRYKDAAALCHITIKNIVNCELSIISNGLELFRTNMKGKIADVLPLLGYSSIYFCLKDKNDEITTELTSEITIEYQKVFIHEPSYKNMIFTMGDRLLLFACSSIIIYDDKSIKLEEEPEKFPTSELFIGNSDISSLKKNWL